MKRMETGLPGVYVIEPQVFGDSRGYFMETYSYKKFEELGIPNVFVQDNQSFTAQRKNPLSVSPPKRHLMKTGTANGIQKLVSFLRISKQLILHLLFPLRILITLTSKIMLILINTRFLIMYSITIQQLLTVRLYLQLSRKN